MRSRSLMDCKEDIGVANQTNKGFHCSVWRLTFAFVVPILVFFFLVFLIGTVAILSAESSTSSPVSVSSQCRIVSSSVDLKSSRVCELGLLNYKAKHVFYPFDKTKYRCRYDYYWASVFKVEYKDHSLGRTRFALAESPNEALPQNCRPNFGEVWLSKDKFKINETYDCSYLYGMSKVRLHHDSFSNCQAKDPSAVEMLRRYYILSRKLLLSWFMQKKGKAKYWRWETVAGVVTGFSTSLISISFIRILHHMKSWLPQTYVARILSRALNTVLLRRACFLVVYSSILGWLTIQYGRRLGLAEIYRV